MVSPPFHLSSVVSDPSLLFNLMAHTHVHTHTHTHGTNIGCGNGSGNGSEAALGASATRGGGGAALGAMRHRGEAASETASEARRHRVWHRGQGGIGGLAASGASARLGGEGAIGGGIGGEAASGASAASEAASGVRRHRGRHRGRVSSGASAWLHDARTRARLFLRGKGRTCARRAAVRLLSMRYATTIYVGSPAWCSSSC